MENREDAERFLEIIVRQSHRLEAIIEDLLCLSRLEQGTGETRRELGVYPLRDVLSSALQTVQLQADARNMVLRLECSASLKTRLDPPLLEQAVVNLVVNAVKYSESGQRSDRLGGGRGRFRARLGEGRRRGHRRPTTCRGSSSGSTGSTRRRSRQEGGTGLGLAIVKHIARFHDGHVTVRSSLGEGSLFTLHLPYYDR